jgi:methylmalonyl-CoA mutase
MSIKHRIEQFVSREGRRPRILISNMGKENHDHDTKLLAALFAEAGFDVDLSPLNQTPRGTARMASENDVHAICFLSTDNQYNIMATALSKELKKEGFENVKILLGGFIPDSDYTFLNAAGVDLIFSTAPTDSVEINDVLDLFE